VYSHDDEGEVHVFVGPNDCVVNTVNTQDENATAEGLQLDFLLWVIIRLCHKNLLDITVVVHNMFT